MKTTKRIKPEALKNLAQFHDTLDTLAQLSVQRSAIEATMNEALQMVRTSFAPQFSAVDNRIAALALLAEGYAETNRDTLLSKDEKSAESALARFGFRTGNRTVKLLSRVKEDQAIAALEAQGLEAYVRITKEIDRAGILRDCIDGKTLARPLRDPCGQVLFEEGVPLTEFIEISEAGLKIAQAETFYVEPKETVEPVTPIKAVAPAA